MLTGNYESNSPLYRQADNNGEEDDVSWANKVTEQNSPDNENVEIITSEIPLSENIKESNLEDLIKVVRL